MKIFKKPFVYAVCFGLALTSLNGYALAKKFLISDIQGYVIDANAATESEAETTASKSEIRSKKSSDNSNLNSKASINKTEDKESTVEKEESDAKISTDSYEDENIKINISTVTKYNTQVYIADIKLSSVQYLKTALANNAFGTNVVAKTSEIAKDNNAIFAVNGDYYGANSQGYVIKNGVIYRNSVRRDYDNDDLAIYEDGSMEIINEAEISAQELVENGVYNLLSFGPALIKDSQIVVDEYTEVSRAMSENPRTAIGIIDDLHYVIIVSDGRTSESEGLSLYEMATIFKELGAITAYNLDGGGSSTMYFNGNVVNNPTTSGRHISEREVSDIVYIGY